MISPDRQLFAAVSGQGNNLIITTADGNQILTLEGAYPNFSEDGRYLYYLDKNNLMKLILSLDEIRSLVFEKRIFGDPETGKQIWLLL